MNDISFSKRMESITGSAIRELFHLLNDPNVISLAGGNPSPKTFPSERIAEISSKVLCESGDVLLQYGATEGFGPLRESCVALNAARGIDSTEENILPTAGSSQGIELAAKVFLDETDVVLVENPTFLGALQTFRSFGARPAGVALDEEGMDIADLESQLRRTNAKMIYVIPNFQNPTGTTWSAARRAEVLALAARYDALLLEDDPYGELRYDGEDIASIKSLAQKSGESQRVVHLSSFSKTVSPGLRLGYVTAHPAILRKMCVAKQGMDVHSNNLSQAIVDAFLRSGEYVRHVQSNCAFYKEKRDAMMRAVEQYFPASAQVNRPRGGLFVWVRLNEDVDCAALLSDAVRRGVAYVPGTHFYADLSGKSTMRLNFSLPSGEEIDRGCKILAELLRESGRD